MIFVYLGGSVPKYALRNLQNTADTYSGRVILLSTHPLPRHLRKVENVLVDPAWYDSRKFSQFKKLSTVDKLYRNQFWLHAAERLFVLRSYVEKFSVENFFHAELDVLLFNLEDLEESLRELDSTVFLPPEGARRALASLIFVKHAKGLDHLISFLCEHAHLGNEMKILGAFLQECRGTAIALKSDRLFDSDWPFGLRYCENVKGLVDTSGFGQWLFGPDPRNSSRSSFTRYRSGGLRYDVQNLRFHYSPRTNSVTVRRLSGPKHPVHAIHVHSKTTAVFQSRLVRWIFFSALSLRITLPVRLSTAHLWETIFTAITTPRVILTLEKSPGPIRIASVDVFLKVLRESRRVPSERQRQLFSRLLPAFPEPAKTPRLDNECSGHLNAGAFLTHSSVRKALANSSPWPDSVLREITIFLTAMFSPHEFLLFRGSVWQASTVSPRSKSPLVFSSSKNYDLTRHAVSFWNNSEISNQLSFSTEVQVIKCDWVREMFQDEYGVFDWALRGTEGGLTQLSALHSYATWAYSTKRREVKLFTTSADI